MSRIAIVLGEDFEDSEFRKPCAALRSAGHDVTIVGAEAGKTLDGKKGEVHAQVEKAAKDVDASHFDALVIPGGYSPDHLRIEPDVVKFVAAMVKAGKVIAAICHGPQLLIEAGVVKGKTMTSFPSVKTDLINAGATWVDREVYEDGTFITSRNPHDIPAFIRSIEHQLDALSAS
ncbi:MAG TPA: type 1 glutamine amidotransferase domain-containing protein [Kofleriaceae bacterium]|jgi:protease I